MILFRVFCISLIASVQLCLCQEVASNDVTSSTDSSLISLTNAHHHTAKEVPSTTSGSVLTKPVAAIFEDILSQDGGDESTEDTNKAKDISTSASGSERSTGSSREICDFCIYEGEGNFTSYGYPLSYKNNLNCSYRFQRLENDVGDVCELELVFHDFDVPITSGDSEGEEVASNSCTGDYLEVHGRRFCGPGWRDRTEIVPFPAEHREVTFYFRSNERTSGKGFWVEVRRRPASCFGRNAIKVCEERISEPEAMLASPRFPGDYPNNADCSYYIRKHTSQVCALEMTFLHFDVEPVNGCFYDYLELDGQKLCGSFLTGTKKVIPFDTDQKVVTFHTDKQVARTGFHIVLRQVDQCEPGDRLLLPAPPSCNICSSDPSGTLVSYGYPDNYRNNLLCTYTIDRLSPDICALELHFDNFDVVPSKECGQDFLQINGQPFCGTTLHSARKILPFGLDQSMTFVFKTDASLTSKGFSINFKQLSCSKDDYRPFFNSNHASRSSQAKHVDQDDEVEQKQLTSASVKSPSSVRDERLSLYANGPQCDYVYTDKTFVITSENFSTVPNGHYPHNLDCTYYVKKNSSRVCYLELYFIKFDVEASAQCQFDYIEINNVRLCGSLAKQTTRTYIFDDKEKVIRFKSDGSTSRSGYVINVEQLECDGDIIIRSPSSSPTTVSPVTRHYHGQVSIPPVVKSCSQLYATLEADITSPQYPRPYPQDLDCSYYVRKLNQNVCQLEVTYHDFQLQSPDGTGFCKSDHLDFNGDRMCGSLSSGSVKMYPFSENEFKIRFSSDSVTTSDDQYFRLTIRQIECPVSLPNNLPEAQDRHLDLPSNLMQKEFSFSGNANSFPIMMNGQDHAYSSCDQHFSTVTFEVKSPRHPEPYPAEADCTITVVKAATRSADPICQLEVQFAELDIDGVADNCGDDYLQFGAYGRICGQLPAETIKFFPFDGPTFSINFRSRHKSQRRPGFRYHLRLRQRECMESMPVAKKPTVAPTHGPSNSGHVTQIGPSGQPTDQRHVSPCNQLIVDADFELRSPYYPSAYPDNMDCTYTLRQANSRVCAIELKMVEFDLEDGGNCEFDYVLIDRKRLCGKIKSNSILTFEFGEREKKIHFRSDSARARRGFLITGSQKECSSDTSESANHGSAISYAPTICELCFADTAGTVKSYGWPDNYPANLNCRYKFTGLPGYCSVELKFDEFRLEPMDSTGECSSDYLELNGIRYCGNQLSGATKTLQLKGRPMEAGLRFHSNGHASFSGFKANYYLLPCLAAMNVDHRNAPLSPFVPASELGPMPISVSQYPSSGPSAKASPFSPVITQGEPSITSDQSSSMGVSSSITVIDGPKSGRVPCDLAIYDSIFEVSSPGYPYGYPLNSDCLYSIRKLNDNVCKLRLTFVDFDLETTPACDHDYLQVNGDNICGRYGNGTVKDYDFTSHKMALRFMSDNRGTKKGFFIKGQQVMGDECNIHKAGLYGNQRSAPASPAYPPYEAPKASSYPPGVSSNSGQSAFGTVVQLPPPSEQSNQYPFMNSFPVAPSCDKLINDTFFDIKSPQYPMRYESGSKCVYTIRKAHENICYLDIVFGHFDVGDTRYGTCDKSDYVSVEGEKFCGHLQRERMQTFPFQGGEKTILFMGHSGTGQGFHIRGRQIECNRFMSSSSSSRFTHSRALKADSQLNATLTINISDDGTKLRKLNVVKKSIGDDHGRQDGVSRVGRLLLPIRAQLEQIVETQVRVVDNKDGLYSFISNMSNSTHNHQ